MLHLTNLISHQVNPYWVIGQVIFASASGIYWGAVYERSKNFWLVAFLHALEDGASCISYLFIGSKGTELPTYSWSFVVISMIVAIPYLLTAKFLIRKYKEPKAVAINTNIEVI